MAADTKAKIDRLLRELRSWDVGDKRYTVCELVEMFDLPPLVIQRISASEGFNLSIGEVGGGDDDDDDVDPNAITQPLGPKDLPSRD